MGNYVITIARSFGSGGKEIALMLSERLSIPCYDRELLTMASQKSGIDESVFVETDEKLRGQNISNFLGKIPYSNVIEAHEKDFVSDINVFNIQAELIRSLAKTESCIIVGKCADFILQEYNNAISIFVEAPHEVCVLTVQNKMHVTRDRAEQLIRRTDRYRSGYYHYYTCGKEWKDPDNYDMLLNSARIGRERCVELICEYKDLRFPAAGSSDHILQQVSNPEL
jgi:cytidylate kinase